MKKDKSKNPNLRTKAWGGPAWFYITCVAMGYPEKNPTKKQQNEYKKFYVSVGKTLPCCLCRESYDKFIKDVLTAQYLDDTAEIPDFTKRNIRFREINIYLNHKFNILFPVSSESIKNKLLNCYLILCNLHVLSI